MYLQSEFSFKFNSLSKWKCISKVNCACGSSHILFPWIRTTFTTTTSLFFSSKCTYFLFNIFINFSAYIIDLVLITSNLCTWGSNVNIDYSAIGSKRSNPFKGVLNIISENRTAQTLWNGIIYFNCFFQCIEFKHIENWYK